MWQVVAFYGFYDLTNARDALRSRLREIGQRVNVCGSILLADEGVNGTIAAPSREGLDEILAELTLDPDNVKFSTASVQPFFKYKVRLKKETITMRAPEANPAMRVGQYVMPCEWNDLISREDVLLIDTRNDYEVEMGSFEGALDPKIPHFTHFKDFVANLPEEAKSKKIAMFCTGGIRCEKASSYMMAHGFTDVYHLKGGILKYLEDVPVSESKWQGSCFVFDKRVALEHGLEEAVI